MNFTNEDFLAPDGLKLTTYHWLVGAPKLDIIIIHGMAEHAARYDHFAQFLNESGINVHSFDLRGHGKTAGSPEKTGLFALENGWNKTISDINAFAKTVNSTDRPLLLLGHSMGSFLSRSFSYRHPEIFDGYIFSATAGHPGVIGIVGSKVAKLNAKLMGKNNKSSLMDFLIFGGYNKKYKQAKTNKDWISSDEDVVQNYISDPYCGQVFRGQFYEDLLNGVLEINRLSNIQKMPKDKPILQFAGDQDPVGEYGKGPMEVQKQFQRAGIENSTLKMYLGGRHEMLNETNKEEVYTDIIDWIKGNFRVDFT